MYRGNQATTQLTSPAQHLDIPIPSFKMKLKSHYLMGDFLSVVAKRDCPPLHRLSLQLFDCIQHYETVALRVPRAAALGGHTTGSSYYKSPIHSVPPVPLRDWGSSVVKQQTSEELIAASRIKPGEPSTTSYSSGSTTASSASTSTSNGSTGSGTSSDPYWTAVMLLEHLYEAAGICFIFHPKPAPRKAIEIL